MRWLLSFLAGCRKNSRNGRSPVLCMLRIFLVNSIQLFHEDGRPADVLVLRKMQESQVRQRQSPTTAVATGHARNAETDTQILDGVRQMPSKDRWLNQWPDSKRPKNYMGRAIHAVVRATTEFKGWVVLHAG